MKRLRIAILSAVAAFAPMQLLHATEYSKQVTVVGVETHAAVRPASPSSQGREFLHLTASPAWAVHSGGGGALCNEEAALLPTDNAMMRATALAAIASGSKVFVVVDNTLAGISGVCQITLLHIQAD
jgi:hypothetical protein